MSNFAQEFLVFRHMKDKRIDLVEMFPEPEKDWLKNNRSILRYITPNY
jgi:hypothetical protein